MTSLFNNILFQLLPENLHGRLDFAVALTRQSGALPHALHIIAVRASMPGYRPLSYDPSAGRFEKSLENLARCTYPKDVARKPDDTRT